MVNKTLHYILNISIKIMSHKLRIYLRKIPAVMFTETLIVWPTLIWLTSPRTAIQCIAFPSWDDLGLSSIYDYFMINRLLTIFNGNYNYIPRNFWRKKQFSPIIPSKMKLSMAFCRRRIFVVTTISFRIILLSSKYEQMIIMMITWWSLFPM